MHGQKGKSCWVSVFVCLRNHEFEDHEGQIAICDALERVHWSMHLEQRTRLPKQRRVVTKTLHYSHTAAGWLNHVGWWRQMKQTIQAQTSNHFGERATDGHDHLLSGLGKTFFSRYCTLDITPRGCRTYSVVSEMDCS